MMVSYSGTCSRGDKEGESVFSLIICDCLLLCYGVSSADPFHCVPVLPAYSGLQFLAFLKIANLLESKPLNLTKAKAMRHV